MKCPTCSTPHNVVIDTRTRGPAIRRRRECFNGHRYSTLEVIVKFKHGIHAKPEMKRKKNSYPAEFKQKLREEHAAGTPLTALAVEYGIPEGTLVDILYRRKKQ